MTSILERITIARIEEEGYILSGVDVNRSTIDEILWRLYVEAVYDPSYLVFSQEDHDALCAEIQAEYQKGQAEHQKMSVIFMEEDGVAKPVHLPQRELQEDAPTLLNGFYNKTAGRMAKVFVRPISKGTIYVGTYPALELLEEEKQVKLQGQATEVRIMIAS